MYWRPIIGDSGWIMDRQFVKDFMSLDGLQGVVESLP
jgi:hypothetical protein